MLLMSIKNLDIYQLIEEYNSTLDEVYIEEIIKRNLGIIILTAKSYLNIPYSELDDLISEGYIVLLQAVQNYDKKYNCKFNTFLKRCLSRHYNTLYNKTQYKKRKITQRVLSYDELIENNVDIDTSYNENYGYIHLEITLNSIKLKDQQKAIISCIKEGYSYSETAEILSISPATVNFHIKSIRKIFIENGLYK